VTTEDVLRAAAEDGLRAAARTIGQMPEADIRRKFAQLQEARKARSQHEILRQQAELDSLELDEAAYQAGVKSEEDGDIRTAARWYHAAAVSDFPGASLRFASVLDALAAEYGTSAGESQLRTAMIMDALEWCAKAFAAGEDGAGDLIETLTAHLDPARLQAQPPPAAPTSAGVASSGASEAIPRRGEQAEDHCALGGLWNVIKLSPGEMGEHFRSCHFCRSCLAELAVKLPAVVPVPR
jgi:hypothetical protein